MQPLWKTYWPSEIQLQRNGCISWSDLGVAVRKTPYSKFIKEDN